MARRDISVTEDDDITLQNNVHQSMFKSIGIKHGRRVTS